MEQLNYKNLNDRDSLAIKKILIENGIDEKTYLKVTGTKNNRYSICKFIYIPNSKYNFELTMPKQHVGLFNLKATPLTDSYKPGTQIPNLGFYPNGDKPHVLKYFKIWAGYISNEIKTREELIELNTEPEKTWTETQEEQSKYITTHRDILTSLGNFIVSFETLIAVSKSFLTTMMRIYSEDGGVIQTELLLSDARASSLKNYISSAIERHFFIMEKFYREYRFALYKPIPNHHMEKIIELGGIFNDCLGNASKVRNAIVHATWSKSVQGERLSLYGVKYGLGKVMKIRTMDYTEKEFDMYSQHFDYIRFCFQKLEGFFARTYFNLPHSSGLTFEELFKRENINLTKLNAIKVKLNNFNTEE